MAEGDVVFEIKNDYGIRLSKNVHPKKYRISLEPDLANFTFSGVEYIDIEIAEETSSIELHAVDLEIKFAYLVYNSFRIIPMARVEKDEKRETITIYFPRTLPLRDSLLIIYFDGKLNDKMHGFYRSEYTANGEKRFMATTQFEATDARRAFPCFDEPAIKAGFEITLIIPRNLTAISNMPIKENWDILPGDKNLKAVKFAETPVMSTYLLAFMAGEFETMGPTLIKNGTEVRVYTTPGKKEQGLFAREVAVKTLEFYNEYFGIPYPLPKLDLIAIPDFSFGAMENWGAVTYRETALLIDEKNSSAAAKQRVATVVAHELAHQWFGNLVTMEWWTHLWLNEGFASWIAYLAVDHLFPEWDIWTQFVADDFSQALKLDGLKNSHPIEVEVKDPAEIREIFDEISYSKGASVIRMLESYLGKEKFCKGLNLYLTRNQYGNATTEDLWQALEDASGKPVKKIMDSWTKQTGYPLVTLTGATGLLLAEQTRFISSGEKTENKAQWEIPLQIKMAQQPEIISDILDSEKTIAMIVNPVRSWLKLNSGQTGFYRVKYPAGILKKLQPAISSQSLPPKDRFGLINDAFALARSGDLATGEALELARSYRDEDHFAVWTDLSQNLGELGSLLVDDICYSKFIPYARDLFFGIGKKLGWDARPDDNHLTVLLRGLIIGRLGYYVHYETIFEAQKRFARFAADRTTLDPNLRLACYMIAAKYGLAENNGDIMAYEKLLKLYQEMPLQEEKIRCLQSLGSTVNPELLKRTLQFSISSEVRAQDMIHGIAGVARNPKGKNLAWKFLQDKWPAIEGRSSGILLNLIIEIVTRGFSNEERAKEVEEFFSTNPVSGAERTIKQSLERIRSNARWFERDHNNINQWLEKNI